MQKCTDHFLGRPHVIVPAQAVEEVLGLHLPPPDVHLLLPVQDVIGPPTPLHHLARRPLRAPYQIPGPNQLRAVRQAPVNGLSVKVSKALKKIDQSTDAVELAQICSRAGKLRSGKKYVM